MLLDVLTTAYADEPFVVVSERSPSTKATFGSNAAHITARYDDRTGYVLLLCAIDNLGKGAAGQINIGHVLLQACEKVRGDCSLSASAI